MSASHRFIDALSKLEGSDDAEPLVACFAPDATLINLGMAEQGIMGARSFWTRYRYQFREIRSEFSDVMDVGDRSILVWTSFGVLAKGEPIKYRGVSLLTWRDDRIVHFESIYDSAAFARSR